MLVLGVYDIERNRVAEVELNASVFGAEVREDLLHDVVRMQLASRRRGTASTKERSYVSGGGKKPWRQKGTGRARVGSIRSPLWRGGGIIFGPRPRDYSFKLPKKVRKAALCSALSMKVREDRLLILRDFPLEQVKTRAQDGP